MSLLDAPANGVYIAFVHSWILTDCLQKVHLHEPLHEFLRHAQLHHLWTHLVLRDQNSDATDLVARHHLWHLKTQAIVHQPSDPEDFQHLQLWTAKSAKVVGMASVAIVLLAQSQKNAGGAKDGKSVMIATDVRRRRLGLAAARRSRRD
jgi:hypothetical protein